jgi:histidinol-phosphate aminotransferase
MSVSRRSFVSSLGLGGAGLLAAPALIGRGRESAVTPWIDGSPYASATTQQGALIRLDSNENPNGPSARALQALRGALGEANRYPDRPEEELMAAIAKEHGVGADHVVLGCGSGETLRQCVEAYTSPTAGLVTASPTFENPERFARLLGHPVVTVPVDARLRIDLDAMAAASKGAGLVFLCNPNNPTATVHGEAGVRAFIAKIRAASPNTMILVDEAYHEYVEDPSYRTAIPMVANDPNVIVSRTFSKVFGMAGLRVGYAVAHPETARRLSAFRLGSGVNVLAATAAIASVSDGAHVREEQRKNREAKAMTRAFFEKAGYTVGPSDTNFIMVDLKRDPAPVRRVCREAGVAVGRPFPPLTNWLRISVGTMDEMQRANEVFRRALS